MKNAIIHFADKSTLTLQENDCITPVVLHTTHDGTFSSMADPIELRNQSQFGLLPSITDALCKCSFFYAPNNYDVVYGVHNIVKIEMV